MASNFAKAYLPVIDRVLLVSCKFSFAADSHCWLAATPMFEIRLPATVFDVLLTSGTCVGLRLRS